MLAEDAETLLRVARKYGFTLVNNNEGQSQKDISNDVISELTSQQKVSDSEAKEIARFLHEFSYPRTSWEGILNLKSADKKY